MRTMMTWRSRTAATIDAAAVLARLQRRLPHVLAGAIPTTPIRQLPMDSLDIVELLCAAEDEFGVTLPADAFATAHSVGDLVETIAKHAARRNEAAS